VFENLGVTLGTADEKGYRELKREPAVKTVGEAPQVSQIKPVSRLASAATKGATFGITRLKVDKLWKKGIIGAGVLVGHLDTRVDGKPPGIQGRCDRVGHYRESVRMPGRDGVVGGREARSDAIIGPYPLRARANGIQSTAVGTRSINLLLVRHAGALFPAAASVPWAGHLRWPGSVSLEGNHPKWPPQASPSARRSEVAPSSCLGRH